MGDNDRELGEISVQLKVLGQNVEAIQRKLEQMSTQGCVIGHDNAEKIKELQGGYRRLLFAAAAILVGGQAGIEWVKALFIP
jgi:hypothetical protein